MKPWLDDTLAANGLPVRENFAAWFGDSKVLSNSEPLVAFHGTWYDFYGFEQSEDIGFHFGSTETAIARLKSWEDDDGSGTEGANVMPVYLAIQNPLRLPDLYTWDSDAVAGALRDAGVLTVEEADAFAEYNDRAMVAAALAKRGFDGIVYANVTEGGGDSWIAFAPEQIKSAIGNSGLYAKDAASLDDQAAARALRLAASALKVATRTESAIKLQPGQQRRSQSTLA